MEVAELVRLVARKCGGRVEDVREIVGQGSINQVFSAGDVIVRVNKDRTPEAALREYRKERWCMEWARERGILVPSVLDVGFEWGRAYIAMERIEGRWGGEVDPVVAYRAVGELSARLALLPGPEDPFVWREYFDGADGETEWLTILRRNVDELTPGDPLLGLGVYGMGEQDRLRGIFNDLLDFPFAYGLCHGDLTPRNLLFSDRGVVLIDWGCAWLGPVPHGDLIELMRDHLLEGAPGFEALGSGEEEQKVMREVVLVKAFDLVRWAIDRCPERVGELAELASRVPHLV